MIFLNKVLRTREVQNHSKIARDGLLAPLGPPWRFLERLGTLLEHLGALLARLGALLARLGAVLERFWGRLGASFGAPGGVLGCLWAGVEAIGQEP